MPIHYLYSGQPMNGSDEDDFVIAYKGSTGTDNNTIFGNGGDDLVIADSSDTWIPSSSYLNGSIANAFNLQTLTSTWTTAENPMFGDSSIPHTTAIVEATIGQSEFFAVAIGAGQQITVDIDFATNTAIGISRDLVVELQDSLGNIIATADDSLVTDGGLGSFPATAGSASSYDPYLTFTVAAAGTYYINVRPFGGGPGSTFTDNSTFVMNVSVGGHATAATNPVQGNDIIDGGAGDDTLFGGGGGDTINGGAGNDLIHGGSGGDIIHGDDDNDVVYGGDGTEENAHGDNGNDILYSGGEGHYYGDAGDDIIYAGLTSGVNEFLDGGNGIDTLDTTTWNGTYVISLATGVTNFGESFTNFENVVTGNGADTITGTAGDNRIETKDGIDTVDGGSGDDQIKGGAGNDVLDGGAGSDLADFSDKTQQVSVVLDGATDAPVTVGGVAEDTIRNFEDVQGGSGNDALTGDAQSNKLYGGIGTDTLLGQNGNDTLDGGLGADTMVGGAGHDIYVVDNVGDVVTESANNGTDLVQSSISFSLAGRQIENLTLTGSGNIDGTGNAFDNTIAGNAGNNALDGGAGNDTMKGGAGNDGFRGSVGADLYDGGAGTDVVNYGPSTGVNVFLDGSGTNGRAALGDTFVGIENLLGSLTGGDFLVGAAGANRLTGQGGDDILWGRAGVDQLEGGAGNDRLVGGTGADVLAGGTGSDTFVFDQKPLLITERDRISDFASGQDHLEIDASVFGGGLVAGGTVDLVANANPSSAGHGAGTFLYNTGTGFLSYDIDGQGAGAAVTFAWLQNVPALTTGDFTIVA